MRASKRLGKAANQIFHILINAIVQEVQSLFGCANIYSLAVGAASCALYLGSSKVVQSVRLINAESYSNLPPKYLSSRSRIVTTFGNGPDQIIHDVFKLPLSVNLISTKLKKCDPISVFQTLSVGRLVGIAVHIYTCKMVQNVE